MKSLLPLLFITTSCFPQPCKDCGEESDTASSTSSGGGWETLSPTTTSTTTVASFTTTTTTGADTSSSSSTTEETETTAPAPFCGDGLLDPGEECDDGNDQSDDSCLPSCVKATCGDGILWTGMETCDDGNDIPTDACVACKPATCGDGWTWDGMEECDTTESCTSCLRDRLVFVTSKIFTGKLIEKGSNTTPFGFEGAMLGDHWCQLLAEASNHPGTFKAWISTKDMGTTERLGLASFQGNFINMAGDVVAVGWADLIDAKLGAPIHFTDDGNLYEGLVWTGTTAAGWPTSYNCEDWKSADPNLPGTLGFSGAVDGSWSSTANPGPCVSFAALYCFQVTPP